MPRTHVSLMIRENSAAQVVYVENWFAELLAKSRQ